MKKLLTIVILTLVCWAGASLGATLVVDAGLGPYFTIQSAIDAATAGDTITIAAGTYLERPVANKQLTFVGADEATVIIDAGIGAVGGSYGFSVSADNVSISNLTLVGNVTISTPRYGFKPSGVANFTLTNVTAKEFFRTGVDLNGVNGGTLTDVVSIDNNGHGFALTDCNNVTLTSSTASGNAWQGVSVQTWGDAYALGTSGIVFDGTNIFVDAFQLEMGDIANPGVPPAGAAVITYSTDILDGADVTLQAADYTFAIHGEQDDGPGQVRIWMAPDLATAALLPAFGGPVGHFTGAGIYIESLVDDAVLHATPGCSIKAAVTAANWSDFIYVASGTYVENGQILVDKDLSIIGDAGVRPVIMTDSNTGGSGDARGWFLQTAGTNLEMRYLEFDGTGFDVYQAIRSTGSGQLDNCAVRNIVFPGYAGVALAAFGVGNWDVTDCTFDNIGRIGFLAFGAGLDSSTFTGNTYTGKGPGDWLDYACDISAGAVVNVQDNTITACQGVASSDGSTSAGLLVTTFFGAGTTATITDNILTGNTSGVAVGFDASDVSIVTGTGNDFSGNDSFGVSNSAPNTVDFIDNEWGDTSGPFHPAKNPGGTGVPVDDYINFTPWTGRTVGPIADIGVTPDGPFYWEDNQGIGVDGDFAPGFGPGCLQAPNAYSKYGFTPDALFGRSVNVGELYSITYYTKKDLDHGPGNEPDWFFQLYTEPYTGSPGSSWYGNRINSEPYFSENLTETPGAWNQWVTAAGQDNRLRFYDSSSGYFGSYTDGFLSDLANDPVFTAQPVMVFDVGLGTAWAAAFDGLIDGVTIELISGEKASLNFISGNNFIDTAPSTSGPLACGVPVTLTFNLETDQYTPPVFGFNAVVRATSEVDFGTITSLDAFGGTTYFYTIDKGDGSWDISGTTIGSPSEPIITPGTHGLFTIEFIPASDGVADITFDLLKLRDPDNVPIPAVGTGATITVDCIAPAAVTAITAAPGHNKVDVGWTHDLTDVDHFEVFSGVWHDGANNSAYPEYDDLAGNVIPTPPAAYPGIAGTAEWLPLPQVGVTNQTQTWADHLSRGVYYYTVFAVDAAGNASAAPAAVDRATNYWLGDVTGQPTGDPNGLVQSYDMDALGDAFGKSDGQGGYNNIIDVGPTDDWSRLGIPLTDSVIDFEDLIVFTMNFGVVGPAKATTPISSAVQLAWVRYDDGRQGLRLVEGTGVKGLNVRADVPVFGVTAGELLDDQTDLTFLRNVGENLDVSVAVAGVNVGFAGSGDLFIVDAGSEITLDDLTIKVRGYDNSKLEYRMDETVGTLTPRVFSLNANYPNPFNPMTKISFSLPETQTVRLSVYGVDGRMVATLLDEVRGPGLHEVVWTGQDDRGQQAASGLYFYRIDAGPYSQVRKMMLMK